MIDGELLEVADAIQLGRILIGEGEPSAGDVLAQVDCR